MGQPCLLAMRRWWVTLVPAKSQLLWDRLFWSVRTVVGGIRFEELCI